MSNNRNRSNYNKMYDAGKRAETSPVDEAIPAEVKEEVVELVSVKMEQPVEAKAPVAPKTVKGTVKCELLNVRVAPNKEATIDCVITKDSEVTIDMRYSTDGWYRVTTKDNAVGYCMKKFIAI